MKNVDWQNLAHETISGGAHTYSRGDDTYPENAPPVLSRAKGSKVWDTEGNRFLDYGMGLRSVTLGYAEARVANAAFEEILKGNNLTRPSTTEIKAAAALCELNPFIERVKFAKNGSTVTTAAVKLARAFTGRKLIVRCKEHPFFSYDDWFIGSTQMNRGVPEEISSLTLQFNYNDLASITELFSKYPDQIAAIIMEPETSESPKDINGVNFLQSVKESCHKNGALFIADEMITGFRWHIKGACHLYQVEPDLVTYGKGMANGFSVAALGGRKDVMDLGGIHHNGERVFLVSTTHGAEMCGLGAFLKTLEIYQNENVCAHMDHYGKKLKEGMNQLAGVHGVSDYFSVEGKACSPGFVTLDSNKKGCLKFRTLFIQEMIKNNVLMPFIALSASHDDEDLKVTLDAADKALLVYKKALNDGVDNYLEGRPIKPVFRKEN